MVRAGVLIGCVAALGLAACDSPAASLPRADTFEPTEAERTHARSLIALCQAMLADGLSVDLAVAHDAAVVDAGLWGRDRVPSADRVAVMTATPAIEVWLAHGDRGETCFMGTNSAHRQITAVWAELMESKQGDPGYRATWARDRVLIWRQHILTAVDLRDVG